jgi:hypothetical protein
MQTGNMKKRDLVMASHAHVVFKQNLWAKSTALAHVQLVDVPDINGNLPSFLHWATCRWPLRPGWLRTCRL